MSSGNGLLLRSKRKDHMSVSGRLSGGNWDEIGIARLLGRGSNRISLDSRFLLSQIAVEVQIISEKTILFAQQHLEAINETEEMEK